jgi:cbb3-type cytochrome c oxidase subunit III
MARMRVGSRGFPNLADGDWLYGGEPEAIKTTLINGRNGMMPAFGAVIDSEQQRDVVHYVRSLSGLTADEHARAAWQDGIRRRTARPVMARKDVAIRRSAPRT